MTSIQSILTQSRRWTGEFGSTFKEVLGRSWLWSCVAIIGFITTVYLGTTSLAPGVVLDVDMQIEGGLNLGAYVNDTFSEPRRLTIIPNVRKIYRFEHLPGTLKFLRIDPTDLRDAKISIFSVTVMSDDHVVRRFNPNELRSWQLYNLLEVPGNPAAFNLVSTSKADVQGDFLSTDEYVVASHNSSWFMFVLDVIRRPDSFPLGFVCWFLFFLLVGMTTARGAVEAGLVLFVLAIAHPLVVWLSSASAPLPSVNLAVGYAGYAGYPKLRDHLISVALLVLCVALAWLASRYIHLPALDPTKLAKNDAAKSRYSIAASIAVFAGLVTIFCPNLSVLLQQIKDSTMASLSWDGENIVLWDYLVRHGYRPFVDYWYPYSGFFTYSLPFPVGRYFTWTENVLALWFLYLGLRYVTRRTGVALVVFLAVFLPCWLNEFLAWYRYVLAIDVALLYVAVQDQKLVQWSRCWAFSGLLALVFFFEPIQLLYSGVAIVVHTCLVAWTILVSKLDFGTRRVQLRDLLRQRTLSLVVPLLVGILPVMIWLASQGLLSGFFQAQVTIRDQAAYSGFRINMADWTVPRLQPDAMFLALFLLLVLTLYAWFRNHLRTNPATLASLVLAFTGFMAMQKQITRSYILPQVQIYPYLCGLLYIVGMFPRRTKAQTVAIALFVAFVAGISQYRNAFQSLGRTEAELPATLAGNWDFFLHQQAAVPAVNAAQDDRERFPALNAELAVVDVLGRDLGWRAPQPVYVLGDDPVFYILLQQAPPDCSNNYNCSPIVEQQRVVDWLRTHRPRFVLWDPSKFSFDLVPHVVRVPLIYQYVAENYRSSRAVGRYRILERGAPNVEFWRQQLGTKIDLGHVPQLTRYADFRDCPSGGNALCQQLMFVTYPSQSAAHKGLLTIDSPAGQFEIAFDVTARSHTYIIDLDRLWFHSLLGTAWRVNASESNAEIKEEPRLRKNGVLY